MQTVLGSWNVAKAAGMLLRGDSIKPLKDIIASVNASATDAGLWLPRQRQTLHHAHCRPQPATDDTANM